MSSSEESSYSDISVITLDESEDSTEEEDDTSSEEEEEDDDSDDSREEESSEISDEPLYSGSRLTVMESYMQIMSYSLRHKLTKQALSDLLSLVDEHLPVSSMVSLHNLRKVFLQMYEDIRFDQHYCCSTCQSPLTSSNDTCRHGCGDSAIEFLTIDIEPQLQRKFQDPVFWERVQKRLATPRDASCLQDLYDGKQYKKHARFLSYPSNISFTLNTDGVKIFNSSTVSLWPIWLVINELPPQIRFSKRNVILAGIWFSRAKPIMTTYLAPVIEKINILSNNGFSVRTPDGLNHVVKARLLLSSVDLPARAVVLNMKQFNGEFGCCYCEDRGVPRPTSALHRNWPYLADSTARTHQSIVSNVRAARINKAPDTGIKGASVFCAHMHFDLSNGCVIDYMHCVCLGVVAKTLMPAWLKPANHAAPFSIRRKLKQCDDRIRKIFVPHDFSRAAQSLNCVKQWKASEYRSWMLYYSIPVLHGILEDPYFTHYCLLVAAMHLMLGSSVSEKDIKQAESYLHRFYVMLPTLYGENACTMNVHMLEHIPDCVRNWGPLWAYSCFSFESMNGHLKKLFHGTRCMNVQLAFSFILSQTIPEKPVERSIRLSDCTPLGNGILTTLSSEVREAVLSHFQMDAPTGTMFLRVMVKGVVYHSKAYQRTKLRNSYSVAYNDDGVVRLGFIRFFLSLHSFTIAVVTPLKAADHYCYPAILSILKQRIIPVIPHDNPTLAIVPVANLLGKCVCTPLESKLYLSKQPNPFSYFD